MPAVIVPSVLEAISWMSVESHIKMYGNESEAS